MVCVPEWIPRNHELGGAFANSLLPKVIWRDQTEKGNAMGYNDRVLLDQLLASRQSKIAPELSESDFFELFVTEELLKNYGLSNEDVDAGIVDGGGDGGIDSVYVFVDEDLVTTDFDFDGAKEEAVIRLVIIQAKTSASFRERLVNSLISTMHDLINLDNPLENFSKAYNPQLLSVLRGFRTAVRELADRFPEFRFDFYYATKGDSRQVHPNVERRVETLRSKVSECFSEFDFSFEFLGARDLLSLTRRQARRSLPLKVAENLMAEGEGAICLVRLKDYFSFITDEHGQRRQNLFDANVREYEGNVDVNKAIRRTLAEGNQEVNFWWLNNGITVVASKAPLVGKTLTLENPKVVNGLQTSHELHSYFSETDSIPDDDRLILVRVIITDDEAIRNQIIKATNSQSRIPPYALRTTEPIHHDIEQHFRFNDLFYDRQKNYYKNLGKPRRKIITPKFLAQAVAASILQEPNNSRGRPTDLIKKDEKYERIFNESYDIRLYLKCARLMLGIDAFLRTRASEQARKEKTNLRFPLAMFVSAIKANSCEMTPEIFVAQVSLDDVDDDFLSQCTHHVLDVFMRMKQAQDLDSDRIAKSKEFDMQVLERLEQILSGTRPFEFEPGAPQEET